MGYSAGAMTPYESANVEAIELEIVAIRQRMSETIDAIQERLTPAHLKEAAKDIAVATVRHAAHETAVKIHDKAHEAVVRVAAVAHGLESTAVAVGIPALHRAERAVIEVTHKAEASVDEFLEKGSSLAHWARAKGVPKGIATAGAYGLAAWKLRHAHRDR